MAGSFGGLRNGSDERRTGSKVLDAIARVQCLSELPPVLELGVEDVLRAELLHGPIPPVERPPARTRGRITSDVTAAKSPVVHRQLKYRPVAGASDAPRWSPIMVARPGCVVSPGRHRRSTIQTDHEGRVINGVTDAGRQHLMATAPWPPTHVDSVGLRRRVKPVRQPRGGAPKATSNQQP